jgi:hypothetical protein
MTVRVAIVAWAIGLMSIAAAAQSPGPAANANVILDETGYWRQYYRFGANAVSAKAMAAEGDAVLGAAGVNRVRQQAEKAMQGAPAGKDWRDFVIPTLYLGRYTAPTPPDDWASIAFDDGGWVFRRNTFQGETRPEAPDFDDRALVQAYYRARFVVDDPVRTGALTLHLVYRGGARVFVNGVEVGRGHLPAGDLAADTPGDDYPAAAYQQPTPMLCDRVLGPVAVPVNLLVKGVNVLAIEVRASRFHPIVMSYKVQRNWCDSQRSWPHAHISSVRLAAAAPVTSVRKQGVQVWVADIHHRTESTDYLPAGEPAGTIRIVGGRNGAYGAQVVIGADKPLQQARVAVSELKQDGGGGRLSPETVNVFYELPFPVDEFTVEKLGDPKGMGSKFPDTKSLAQFEAMADPGKTYLFDHLRSAAGTNVAANACQPVWLSFRIPADAPPGIYRGKVTVTAQGMDPVDVPVEAEIVGWRVPDPAAFAAVVACEESPFGVARQYGVPMWSDAHFNLLEASLKQLGRVGNRWVDVPVIRNTEYGNRDDSMIQWIRKKDGTFTFDFTVLDRYLDLATKCLGRAPIVHVVVMHGTKSTLNNPPPPEVMALDEATGKRVPVSVMTQKGKEGQWPQFGKALSQHMELRGMRGNWFWGYPADGKEDDANLLPILAQVAPEAFWTRGAHCLLPNFAPDRTYYRLIIACRYWGNMAPYRSDLGWKNSNMHLLSPRVDSTCISMHTTSYPFAWRVMPDQALARGRNGIARIAADGWAGTYFSGMAPRIWVTGLPILFTLWPGPQGAESSVRFEVMLEGLQEAEARIFLEKAVDGKMLQPDVAGRVTALLADRLKETTIFQPNITVYEVEKYHYRWQERSRALYQAAAEASGLLKKDAL